MLECWNDEVRGKSVICDRYFHTFLSPNVPLFHYSTIPLAPLKFADGDCVTGVTPLRSPVPILRYSITPSLQDVLPAGAGIQ